MTERFANGEDTFTLSILFRRNRTTITHHVKQRRARELEYNRRCANRQIISEDERKRRRREYMMHPFGIEKAASRQYNHIKNKGKYSSLIDDECVNVNPGKNYSDYKRIGDAKRKALLDARMKKFKKEFEARVKRRGRLDYNAAKDGYTHRNYDD